MPRGVAEEALRRALTPAHLAAILEEEGYVAAARAVRGLAGGHAAPGRRGPRVQPAPSSTPSTDARSASSIVVRYVDATSGAQYMRVVETDGGVELCAAGRLAALFSSALGGGRAEWPFTCWPFSNIYEALAVAALAAADSGLRLEKTVVDGEAYRRLAWDAVTGSRWGKTLYGAGRHG